MIIQSLANQPVRSISKQQQTASKRINLRCTNCGNEYEKLKCERIGNTHFCSQSCFVDYRRKMKVGPRPRNPNYVYKNGRPYARIKCDDCSCELLRRTDQLNQHGSGNFCKECVKKRSSKANLGNTRVEKTGTFVPCEVCGETKYILRYKVAKRRFCSKKCQHKWHRENVDISKFISKKLSGEDHPRYKHGRRVGKCTGKPKIRLAVAERDGGNWCLFCGKPGPGLHLHRIIYGSQGGEYETENCVLLCGDHHGLVHTSKKTWQQQLIDYIMNPVRRAWLDETPEGIRYKRILRDSYTT